MLSTPDYSHFTTHDYEEFYEPGEDTFLFLDALEADMKYLNLINSKNTLFFATDLNKNACLASGKTSTKNGNILNIVNCDLVGPLIDRLEKSIDILLFNPPYVVTEAGELGSNGIEAAWAGGKDGREVMDRIFPLLDRILAKNGIFYLVCIKPNRVEDIGNVLAGFGFKMSVVLNRKAGIENLFVLKIVRYRE